MSMSATELLRLCRFTLNQLANTAVHNTGTGHHNTHDIAAELDKFLKANPEGYLGRFFEPSETKPNPWTEERACDAMILWEVILENPKTYKGVEQFREAHGVCETRDRVLKWVEPLDTIFEAAREEGWDAPYDFEFVPLFLEHCTSATHDLMENETDLGLIITPDYFTRMGSYLALLGKADHMQSMTLQSIRKINGTGKGPAFGPADIKKSVDI